MFSLNSFILVTIGVIVYWRVTPLQRANVLIVMSLVFLYSIMSAYELIILLSYSTVGYGLIWLSHGKENIATHAAAILCWLIIYFLVAGYFYEILNIEAAKVPVVIGISYILFRVLQIQIDVKEGISSSYLRPSMYFLYTMNFLTVLSGPIQRVENFAEQVNGLPNHKFVNLDLVSIFYRLSVGLVKVLLLSSIVMIEHQSVIDSLLKYPQWDSLKIALIAMSYLVFVYLNFSG